MFMAVMSTDASRRPSARMRPIKRNGPRFHVHQASCQCLWCAEYCLEGVDAWPRGLRTLHLCLIMSPHLLSKPAPCSWWRLNVLVIPALTPAQAGFAAAARQLRWLAAARQSPMSAVVAGSCPAAAHAAAPTFSAATLGALVALVVPTATAWGLSIVHDPTCSRFDSWLVF